MKSSILNFINSTAAILISIILFLIFYLFISTQNIEKELNQNLNNLYLNHIKILSKNVESFIKKYCKNDIYNTLKNNPELREYLQDSLSLLTSSPHKYIYILYRDKNGKYRYLLDGSKEERGEFDQKFDVEEKEWNKVYKTKKDRVIVHMDSDILYETYLYPIIYNNKIEGILAIDFTNDLPKTISDILEPVHNIFKYIFLSFSILVLLLIYQIYLYSKAKRETMIDSLTEAFNRRYLRKILDEINPSEYSIMMLDIDHFKKINDNYGHKAGDMILRETSEHIKRILREEDIFIRYGGEEFLIFLKKPKNIEDVIKIAERLRKKFEKIKFHYENKLIKITISIGVTLYPERFRNIKNAIKKADEMLYIAKRGGRNKVIYDENENVFEIIDNDIDFVKEAIEEDRLICHFQPIIELKTAKIASYEALVRIVSKEGEIIYPGAFLEKIAFTTVYHSLTKRVLSIAFETIKNKKVKISINLNFSDISDNTIFSIILKEVEKNKELAKYLTFELLENEALINKEDMVAKIKKLKEFGISITIDDFGSGYANFDMLKTLPIDTLKIDGTIVKEIDKSPISYSIVKAIALFSKEAGLKTVGEFVENEKIAKILKELSIDYAQGYYFGKPDKLI